MKEVETVYEGEDIGIRYCEEEQIIANGNCFVFEVFHKVNKEAVQRIAYEYQGVHEATKIHRGLVILDVNFDGQEDVLVYAGNYGKHGAQYYDAFLWEDGDSEYKLDQSFRKIANPVVASKESVILSYEKESDTVCYFRKYVYENQQFILEAELKECFVQDEEEAVYSEYRRLGNEMVLTSEMVSYDEIDYNYWDLDNQDWFNNMSRNMNM